ncbi:hypothetical protein CDD81_451 [Ophiocordyceps australis]|uniref:Uncharacterized protein n=1 Tax=Ophiocordyceps australis TaxID=1399860 RepID=A0A2C5Y139_9HYPO|nr:hypothetical protein CDD81_451 [Ophiocordyceps australis]
MSSPPTITLTSTDSSTSSPTEPQLINILSAALNSTSSCSSPQSAADKAASQIDQLYPGSSSSADSIEAFLWSFWSLLIAAAKKISATDNTRHKLLVDIVAKLKTCRDEHVELWGQQTRVWGELPMLGPCMREAWNLRPDFNSASDEAIAEWISLNSFAARLLAADLQPWINFAIWELRASLEEEPPSTTKARDAGLAASCEWISHAGPTLHRQGREARQLDAVEQRALKPGRLFHCDTSGLSDVRWSFWKERLGLLGAGAGSGELKQRSQQTIDGMKEVEDTSS